MDPNNNKTKLFSLDRLLLLPISSSHSLPPMSSSPTAEKSPTQWPHWGTNSYSVMPHISPQSEQIGKTYQLRPSDVVVLSFPKTGTTWTQNCCEQLRTHAEGYSFDDITERQPWIEFAYDLGQDLDDEQVAKPRVFKSHQLLSAVNSGGKYLCIVRDPAATLLSWFEFQKAKGRPGYIEYKDVNEYVEKRPELFSSDVIFGTNIWEMYAEIWSARLDPTLKVLVYEALLSDGPAYLNHLPQIAEFLGVEDVDDSMYSKVAFLVSRNQMVRHVDAFDDHFITNRGRELGRALKIMEPAPKVRCKSDSKNEPLSDKTTEWLEDMWLERMTPLTGHTSYDEFAAAIADLSAVEEETIVEDQGVRKSILIRRSSVTIAQMPALRRRRESLAPHE